MTEELGEQPVRKRRFGRRHAARVAAATPAPVPVPAAPAMVEEPAPVLPAPGPALDDPVSVREDAAPVLDTALPPVSTAEAPPAPVERSPLPAEETAPALSKHKHTLSQDAPALGASMDAVSPDGDSGDSDDAAADAETGSRRVPPLDLPRIVAIANQKGGVGKTTTAINLGAALAESGLRVLVVDLDPQGNASTGLGINPRDVGASIYDVLMRDVPAMDAVEPTSLKNLFVIPATIDLAGAEIELVPAFSRELKLRRSLDTLRPDYDIVLIDCPPSLGLLTVNGLAAADDVIVPIQCEYYALEGLGQLLRNVALVRSSLNPELDVRGIILTMYDGRTSLARQVETEVREHFANLVYRTVVPRTVRLSEAPSFGQPIIVFDSTSRGAKAYRKLAKEVSGGATRRTG